MAQFFILRPIFAWVLAILTMLAGVIALTQLPVAQYPTVAPPSIQITATYSGASAEIVEESVAQVIETQMTGLEDLLYMSSTSSSTGQLTMILTFALGTDPDIAQVQVQNKLTAATPMLPEVVQQQGILVEQTSSSFLMVVGFTSSNPDFSDDDIGDYLSTHVVDPLGRIEGVGQTQLFGSEYAMRIWLDPFKLKGYNLMPSDVVTAISAQNIQVATGQLGSSPTIPNQELNATITSQSQLTTVKEFEDILLTVSEDGSRVLLSDVAKVELGAQSYQISSTLNQLPSAGIGISLTPEANALTTANAVRAKLKELEPFFPEGFSYAFPYDTTTFIEISIEEVVKTLIEAVVLVFLVMLLFLQNLRATLIPTIAVPVVLLGTLAVLLYLGYSINTLTMFAMVMAIGLLVDDAIVVVENVERIMAEEGLSPKEATIKSMKEITSALVGIGVVLVTVFIPMAFFTGSTGEIYRQFSITIVTAVSLSVLVAIILTPTLCIALLRHKSEQEEKGFTQWFNTFLRKATERYGNSINFITHRRVRFVAIFLLLSGAMLFGLLRLPTGFLPDEDQGILFTIVQLPDGSTQQETEAVLKKVQDYYLTEEKNNVESIFSIAGFSFAGSGTNTGMMFIGLSDWSVRDSKKDSVFAIIQRAMGEFSQDPDALIFAIAPPPIISLGNATGFDMYLQNNGNGGHEALVNAQYQLLGVAAKNPALSGVRPNSLGDTNQYKINVNHLKAMATGVSIADVNSTLGTALGGSYVNDFSNNGQVRQVYVQADAPYRMTPDNIFSWFVRNQSGEMVPMSSIAEGQWGKGPAQLTRYNGIPAIEILGTPASGVSTGEAMETMQKLVDEIGGGIGMSWTGISYQEVLAGDQAALLYALSILIVFLCLAALYESWSVPFGVILVLPLALLGAILATSLLGLTNNVYFKVGLLTTMALGAKNAILIIEFAKQYYDQGEDLYHSAIHAAKVRLRPILMTSFAFGMGVLPLAMASGAGAAAQNAVGTGIVGGVIAATFLGIFFVPLFFVVINLLFPRKDEDLPHKGEDVK